MSIFPKHVTHGENVVIHLRFENSSKKTETIKYQLSVKNPEDKQIYEHSDSILLGKANYLYETYFPIKIEENFLSGKYKVVFSLTCRGVKIESSTKDWDFFFVEQVKFYKKENKIILENNSNEVTKCSLYDREDNILELELQGKEKKLLDDNYSYIIYGNNKVFPIPDLQKKYYLKNPDIKICDEYLLNIKDNHKFYLSPLEINQFKKMPAILSDEEYNKKFHELGFIIDFLVL